MIVRDLNWLENYVRLLQESELHNNLVDCLNCF